MNVLKSWDDYIQRTDMYLHIIASSNSRKDKLKYFVLLLNYLVRFKKYLCYARFKRFKYTMQAKLLQLYLFEFSNDDDDTLTKNEVSVCYKKIFHVSIDKNFNRITDTRGDLSSRHRIFYDDLALSPKQNYLICFKEINYHDHNSYIFYRTL